MRQTVGYAILAVWLTAFGCEKRSPTTESITVEPTFSFTVHDVFYIKPPVDRVILTGVVDEGTVKIGDELTVHTRSGPITVTIDMVELPSRQAEQATKGDQAGLRLVGIRKEQAERGDRITSKLKQK